MPSYKQFSQAIFFVTALATWGQAEVLTFYSDSGFAYGLADVPVYSGCASPSASVVADGQNIDLPVVPAGRASWKTSDANPSDCYFGWGAAYPAMDLSRFSAGELRFWIYSSISGIKVEIKDSNGDIVLRKDPIGLSDSQLNQWVQVRIPFAGNLTGSGLSNVVNPFLFTALQAPAAFYIDQVRYVDSSMLSPTFNASLKNVSDNSPASELTWNTVALPAGWVRADQYISLDVDPETTSWGIQLYTDNTAPDANPQYSGTEPISAGLIDTVDTARRLPMAWATRSDISTITVVSADPNNAADPNSFQWLMFEDKAQQAVPSLHAAAFQNGDPYVTAVDNRGLHFGQSPSEFGAENSPYRIYLQADFGQAITPRTYKTSALRIEYFTQ